MRKLNVDKPDFDKEDVMQSTGFRKTLCAVALSLTPFLVFAGGTNSQDDAATGHKNDPDRTMERGDMGIEGDAQTRDTITAPGSGQQAEVDDSALTEQVEHALKSDVMLEKLDIDVEVDDGTVTLSGNAKDIRWQARAVRVAQSVQGVKSVKNELKIEG